MSRKDYKAILGFSDPWFTLGVATEETLILAGWAYEASGDKSGEHYRYGAFLRYLGQHRPLASYVAEALYELGNADPDHAMGGNIMADIVDLPECPPSVIAKALASDRQHLVRKVSRNRLLSELQPSITAETFDRLFHDGDGVVHLGLLKHVNLSTEQVHLLAEQGANKQIRRMATAMLGQQNKPA